MILVSFVLKLDKLNYLLLYSSKPFDLIHLDIWGPYHTTTLHDCKYFLAIVDDYSRTTWTHLQSNKSNAFTMIKSFVSMVKTQFSSIVKIFRVDNALEIVLVKKLKLFPI